MGESEVLVGATGSRGGDWIWEESECFKFAEVDDMDSYGGYHDDMPGGRLDPAAVIKAREEDMSFIRSYKRIREGACRRELSRDWTRPSVNQVVGHQ